MNRISQDSTFRVLESCPTSGCPSSDCPNSDISIVVISVSISESPVRTGADFSLIRFVCELKRISNNLTKILSDEKQKYSVLHTPSKSHLMN